MPEKFYSDRPVPAHMEWRGEIYVVPESLLKVELTRFMFNRL